MIIKDSLLILFIHLERTGGSTVNSWFGSTVKYFNAGVNYFEYRFDSPIAIPADSLVNPRVAYLHGHFSLSQAMAIDGVSQFEKILIITILRKPIDRIISGYRLWLRSPDWFPDLDGVAKTFPTYYAATKSLYSMNLACRRFSDTQNADLAIEILRRRFAIVGISEKITSFKSILGSRLNELIPNFQLEGNAYKSNQGIELNPQELEQHGLTSAQYEQILSDNSEDQRLYEALFDSWYGMDRHNLRNLLA